MKSFISLNNSGGLGNQVALFVHQLAFCREHGAKLTVASLGNHRVDFIITGNDVTFLPAKASMLRTFTRLAINTLFRNSALSFLDRYIINKSIDPTDGIYKKISESTSYTIWSTSWNPRFHSLVKLQLPTLRQSLQFAPAVKENAARFMQLHQLDGSVMKIGIHIRRGDYKEFEGGRYFYPLEYYYTVMESLATKFAGRKIVFIIFSNETNKLENPAGFSIIYSNEKAITDLCIMSQLDLLAGPPSTFSGTASFMGNVPFLELKDKEKDLASPKFSVYEI